MADLRDQVPTTNQQQKASNADAVGGASSSTSPPRPVHHTHRETGGTVEQNAAEGDLEEGEIVESPRAVNRQQTNPRKTANGRVGATPHPLGLNAVGAHGAPSSSTSSHPKSRKARRQLDYAAAQAQQPAPPSPPTALPPALPIYDPSTAVIIAPAPFERISLDVLHAIASFLHPKNLLPLIRLNKRVRKTLLHPGSAPVWLAAYFSLDRIIDGVLVRHPINPNASLPKQTANMYEPECQGPTCRKNLPCPDTLSYGPCFCADCQQNSLNLMTDEELKERFWLFKGEKAKALIPYLPTSSYGPTSAEPKYIYDDAYDTHRPLLWMDKEYIPKPEFKFVRGTSFDHVVEVVLKKRKQEDSVFKNEYVPAMEAWQTIVKNEYRDLFNDWVQERVESDVLPLAQYVFPADGRQWRNALQPRSKAELQSDFLALWQPYLAILWRQLIRFGYSSPSTYGWSSDADGQERIKKAKQYLRKLDPATRQAAPSV